jgi:hypothetical protein
VLATRDEPQSLELPQVLSVLHWQVECQACRRLGREISLGERLATNLDGFFARPGGVVFAGVTSNVLSEVR